MACLSARPQHAGDTDAIGLEQVQVIATSRSPITCADRRATSGHGSLDASGADFMITDSHCHAGKGDGLTRPWDTAAPPDKYLLRAAQAGITHTVLFAAFHSDYAVANREVARIVSGRPDRFFGFAFVNAFDDRGRIQKLVRQSERKLAAQMTARGDPWVQDEVPR